MYLCLLSAASRARLLPLEELLFNEKVEPPLPSFESGTSISLPWVLLRGLLEELLPQLGWKAYSARPVLPPEPQWVGLPVEEL